ncbi:hypothetical protein [Thalassobacillus devorans]|uniref:hypothetical protein n=1 Tax=Thalassobacillus devorans TaxID=279813 RepID=UPI0004908845|nr:hypothetical protein [Thalassobacillus devorans]
MEINKETIAIMATVMLAAGLAVSGFFIVKSIKDGRTVLTAQADYQVPRDARLHQEKDYFHKSGVDNPIDDFFNRMNENLQEAETDLEKESLELESGTEAEAKVIESQESTLQSTWEPDDNSAEKKSTPPSSSSTAPPSSSSNTSKGDEDKNEAVTETENTQGVNEETNESKESPAQTEESEKIKDVKEETGQDQNTEKENDVNNEEASEDEDQTAPPEEGETPPSKEGEEEPPAPEDPKESDGGLEN